MIFKKRSLSDTTVKSIDNVTLLSSYNLTEPRKLLEDNKKGISTRKKDVLAAKETWGLGTFFLVLLITACLQISISIYIIFKLKYYTHEESMLIEQNKKMLDSTISMLQILTSFAIYLPSLVKRVDSFNNFCWNSLQDQNVENIAHSKIDEVIDNLVLKSVCKNDPISDIKMINNINKNLHCQNIQPDLRFDCHPEDGASELSCADRNCCWTPISNDISNTSRIPLNIPYCYYPSEWPGYKYDKYNQDGNNFLGFLSRSTPSFYKNDIKTIQLESISIDNSILRVKMTDRSNHRYEPPWPLRNDRYLYGTKNTNEKYEFRVDPNKTGFMISRSSDKTPLFDSIGMGGLIFADQFLQINALLPSHNIYGLGEHREHLKLNTNWQSYTFFNKDQPPTEGASLYGSHPFYLIIEASGNCHGVLFLNSNAMDVILQPTPAITFRSIGGIFDMYFFLGPTPADVLKQYSEVVGKPFMPPYWSLGFHLCRFGYGSLEKTKEVWNRTRTAGIPLDTQWNDLDYMSNNNDFTYSEDNFKDLPKFIDELHTLGMHYIPLIDAGISAGEVNGTYPPYDEGLRMDIFIKDSETNQPFVGKVWNRVSTVWPDFTHKNIKDYYTKMMNLLHKDVAFDGAWIDMNEPSNFYNGHINGCTQNKLDYPPYVPNVVSGLLATKTVCMNAQHSLSTHYNLHNTYGTSQAITTNHVLKSLRNKRPFIISRSTWVGHGAYAGHWTGDIYSSWHDLRMSIPEILAFSFFQVPMVGADICGFDGNTTETLCNRWMQLGAFYPFSRNHNSDDTTEQDPVAMGDLVVRSSKKALTIRYWLLPYLYTLFYRAHRFGETVARPLFFEFPQDVTTYVIDTQFLWGSSFMIVPVLQEGDTSVKAYLPRGLWYDLYSKLFVFSTGKYFMLDAPLDTIPLLIRGGYILPAQEPKSTTTESRKSDFELLIALDQFGEANGELYWDDGDSLDTTCNFQWLNFTVKEENLSSDIVEKPNCNKKFVKFNEKMILGKVRILGITRTVSRVFINDKKINFNYDPDKSYLKVQDLSWDLHQKFTLSWKYE
ncbi:lysosomal alpha-glucosidase [Cephus cinctus]|uniref:Lysosomal alpha-glucosidase n=1 Tax=Cephus cinctus TaxID=211228 RepID=A0AAJ7BK86_CEPCN|nr:lysosomal alpha-glucosidase [Cephus cinctus]